MKSSHTGRQALAAALIALGAGLTAAPLSAADPGDATPPAPGPVAPVAAAPADPAAAPMADPSAGQSPEQADAAIQACSQMSGAMAYAANYYSDFANDMSVAQGDYGNIFANDSNSTARKAVRFAAQQADDAANTPGLAPEVSAPMRAWSADANKLVVFMGLHLGQDSTNNKANDLNKDASDVQMACANAGTRA